MSSAAVVIGALRVKCTFSPDMMHVMQSDTLTVHVTISVQVGHGDEPYRILVVQTGVYSCISDSIRDANGFYL